MENIPVSPKREKNITEYAPEESVKNTFAKKFTKEPRPYKNGKPGSWFSIQLADSAGERTARYFGSDDDSKTQKIYKSISDPATKVVYVEGKTQEYNGVTTIAIDSNSGVIEPADYNPGDFIPKSKRDIDEMLEHVQNKINLIENPYLNQLLNEFFNNPKYVRMYTESPASMSYHQNWVGGLMEHSLNLVTHCLVTSWNHKEYSLDEDLMIAGCLLHDVGKIDELATSATIDVTDEGNFIGHVGSGLIIVNDLIRNIPDFPDELRRKLLHIIVSHHGKMEFGALKEPIFPEALVVHHVDNLDAKLNNMLQEIEKTNTDSDYIWTRNRERIYRR